MTNVLLEKKGHIAVATINRPKALNALNSQVLEDIDQLVEQVKADDEIRALVITGSGEKALIGVLIILIIMFYQGGLVQLVRDIINGIKKARAKRRLYRYGEEE